MKIAIGERLKPFSHTPGFACLLPGTYTQVKAFPTRIQIADLVVLHLGLTGPVLGFTLQLDLEKNCIWVFGKAKEGFYRLLLKGSLDGVEVVADKMPAQGLLVNGELLKQKASLFFPLAHSFFLPQSWERLSLGLSKEQDWDLVWRRFDLKEILPVLYGLGQKCPPVPVGPSKGTARLLHTSLESFCKTAFSQLLIPRLFDNQYQGLSPEEGQGDDPSFLLAESAKWIRSLFFRQEQNCLELLPASPFDAGRMTGVQATDIGTLDLEWASRVLRRVIFRAASSTEVFLTLQKGLHSFRIRSIQSGRGVRMQSAQPLFLEEGKTYYLDQFQASH